MSDFRVDESENAQQLLRMGRIIVSALAFGPLAFAGVVVVLAGKELGQPLGTVPLVSYMAAGIGALNLVLSQIIPLVGTAQFRKKLAGQGTVTPDDLLPGYQVQTIIGSALLEGAALFNLVACLVEKQTWSLGFAAVLVFGILLRIPSATKMEAWVKNQLELLELERGRS